MGSLARIDLTMHVLSLQTVFPHRFGHTRVRSSQNFITFGSRLLLSSWGWRVGECSIRWTLGEVIILDIMHMSFT